MTTDWMVYVTAICFIVSISIVSLTLGGTKHHSIYERPLSIIASIAISFLGVGLLMIHILLGC